MFCNEAWIDFYLLGLDGLDVAMIWWFFFFFSLIWVFGGQWAMVAWWAWWWWCGDDWAIWLLREGQRLRKAGTEMRERREIICLLFYCIIFIILVCSIIK